MCTIPATGRWGQEDQKFNVILEFQANLGHMRVFFKKREGRDRGKGWTHTSHTHSVIEKHSKLPINI